MKHKNKKHYGKYAKNTHYEQFNNQKNKQKKYDEISYGDEDGAVGKIISKTRFKKPI